MQKETEQETGEFHAKEIWSARPGATRWWRGVIPAYRVGRTRTGTTGSRESSFIPAADVGAQERYATDSGAPLTPHEEGFVTTTVSKKRAPHLCRWRHAASPPDARSITPLGARTRCERSVRNRSGKHPLHPREPLKLSVVAQRPGEKEQKASTPHTRHQVPPVAFGGGALRSGFEKRRRPPPSNHPSRTSRDQLVADLRWRESQNRMNLEGTQGPPVVPQSRGLPQKEGSNGHLSRSRDTRYGTRGPGSRADRNAKTSRHGLLAGDDGASHSRRPSS